MYLIILDRVRSSSLLSILCICMPAGPLLASSRVLSSLVQYLMIRDSSCFFATFLPEYADLIPVVISFSLSLGVMCGNFHCS